VIFLLILKTIIKTPKVMIYGSTVGDD